MIRGLIIADASCSFAYDLLAARVVPENLMLLAAATQILGLTILMMLARGR